jgi:23S rRNA (guanosine2251-2'-O)-methyltransferase
VIASIPIDSSAVESLNAGVATSIALYEIAKSRRS